MRGRCKWNADDANATANNDGRLRDDAIVAPSDRGATACAADRSVRAPLGAASAVNEYEKNDIERALDRPDEIDKPAFEISTYFVDSEGRVSALNAAPQRHDGRCDDDERHSRRDYAARGSLPREEQIRRLLAEYIMAEERNA
jgi:hypothetical protein